MSRKHVSFFMTLRQTTIFKLHLNSSHVFRANYHVTLTLTLKMTLASWWDVMKASISVINCSILKESFHDCGTFSQFSVSGMTSSKIVSVIAAFFSQIPIIIPTLYFQCRPQLYLLFHANCRVNFSILILTWTWSFFVLKRRILKHPYWQIWE